MLQIYKWNGMYDSKISYRLADIYVYVMSLCRRHEHMSRLELIFHVGTKKRKTKTTDLEMMTKATIFSLKTA